jgi:hypothetical protein
MESWLQQQQQQHQQQVPRIGAKRTRAGALRDVTNSLQLEPDEGGMRLNHGEY